jgi:hypothetical protein
VGKSKCLAATGRFKRGAAKLLLCASAIFPFCLSNQPIICHTCVFLGLLLTLVVWFVADFEVLPYQGTPNFNKSESLETGTTTAINYTTCYAQVFIYSSFENEYKSPLSALSQGIKKVLGNPFFNEIIVPFLNLQSVLDFEYTKLLFIIVSGKSLGIVTQ